MKDKYSPLWEKALETAIPTPTAIVHGLIEGNEYQFRVIAVNKAGQSVPSEPGKTFVAKPRFCKILLYSSSNIYVFIVNLCYSGASY